MLHDSVMASVAGTRTASAPAAGAERRRSDRIPFPGELVIAWHHDVEHPARYPVIDAGDGGFRICSSLPMTDGMTGLALRLLPDGQKLNRGVMVVWMRRAQKGTGYEIGLRLF